MEFDAVYFDGLTAASRSARVRLASDGFVFQLGEGEERRWPEPELELRRADANDIRISWKRSPDAALVFPRAAWPDLAAAYPDLLSGKKERRRMAALVGALIAVSAAIAALVFVGVPMAARPLAEATPTAYEETFGANLSAQVDVFLPRCEGSDAAAEILQPTLDRFARAAGAAFPIKLAIVENPAPNAFALPGGHVLATSGFLDAVGEDQEAFLAVLAHEIGHVDARDSMQAFYRNAGIGLVLEVITGGTGVAQQAVLVAGQLTELRFSREQESAADETAFAILEKEGLDPGALARAFDAIERGAKAAGSADSKAGERRSRGGAEKKIASWLSTHPDTDKRKDAAIARSREGAAPPLWPDQWRSVRAACGAAVEEA